MARVVLGTVVAAVAGFCTALPRHRWSSGTSCYLSARRAGRVRRDVALAICNPRTLRSRG